PTRPDPGPDCTAADLRDPGARERCKAGEPGAPLQADPKFQATGEGNAHALGEASTAAGSDAYAEAAHSTAIGSASSAHGVGASALGSGSLAQQVDATAVGMNAVAWGRNSTALGAGAEAGGPASLAMGGVAENEAGDPLVIDEDGFVTHAKIGRAHV